MEIKEDVTRLGFVLRETGKCTVAVQGIPADVAPGTEKELLEVLLSSISGTRQKLIWIIRKILPAHWQEGRL
jgi:hypothetical protein